MKTVIIRLLSVTFSPQLAHVSMRMLGALRSYRGRLLLVAVFGAAVVVLDLLSATAVAALVLALDNKEVLTLPILGEMANPLQGYDQRTAAVICIIGIVGLQLIREGVLFANELISARLGVDVEVFLKSQISQSILSAQYEQIASFKRNDLIVYGTNFAPGVAAFTSELVQLGGICVILILYAASALVVEPAAFLAVATVMTCLVIFTNRMVLRQQKIGAELRDLQFKYHDQLQDDVHGLRDIKILGDRDIFVEGGRRLLDILWRTRRRSVLLRSALTPIQRAAAISFCGVGVVLLVLFSSDDTPLDGFQSLLVVVFLLLRMYGPVAQLNGVRSALMMRLEATECLLNFLEQTRTSATGLAVDHWRPANVAEEPGEPHSDPSAMRGSVGDIVFDHVSYRYHGADVAAVDDLSFTIPARATVAIVGPSGAGKSTVIDLLTKLRHPASGEIRIGDMSLAALEDTDWRRQIAAIHQHGHIFYGTVAENIAMFRDDVAMVDIEEAASRANLLDFIRAAPEGFETRLGGPDTPLSGGQRQRLQIARALLIKPALLILDEATSAQDAIAEDELLRTLKREFADTTIVTVAHRFSAIREAEHIIVLQDGRVAECGDWQTLSQGQGVFRRLFELQSLEIPAARADVQ